MIKGKEIIKIQELILVIKVKEKIVNNSIGNISLSPAWN
jgi:hypothetical protein